MYSFTPCQLHTIVSALVLCYVTLFDSLMMVLCGLRHVGLFKPDIIIQISKEQVCVFCWLSVVNLLSVMHRMNNVRPA